MVLKDVKPDQTPVKNSDAESVCRCEEVSRGVIIRAIEDGARSLDAVKRHTRAGMGLCQGRTCRHLVSKLISEFGDETPERLSPPTVRPPVRPLPVASLLKGEDLI